ncbi:hypothetical protein [Sphingomonas sp. Leaf205]|uniref:hypothetical protein n=1 Tax=Sphingomonas sp. Leaf205 TaxID=2876551 RepID=UPI001E31F236|nr:hypothetical protein [Sphingomonas sp. Leaf205]
MDISGRINDQRLVFLTRQALRRELPDRLVITGLGELVARSTAVFELEPLVVRALRARGSRSNGTLLLQATTAPDPSAPSETDWQAVSVEQLFASTELNQDFVDQATHLLDYHWQLHSRAYGLMFSIRIALRLSPSSSLSALARKPQGRVGPLLQAIGRVLYETSDAKSLVDVLIRSRNPLLRVMGARALGGSEHGIRTVGEMSLVHAALLAAGWNDADAHWIVAQRLKDVLHQRFGARRLVGELEATQANGRRLSTRHQADVAAELEKAAAERLGDARQRRADVEADVQTLVALLARTWPTQVEVDKTLERIESCMVDGNKIKLEVAEALPPGPARNAMLDLALQNFDDRIGLREPAKALEEYFIDPVRDVVLETRIAARALILRYENEQKDLGKRAGQRIAKLSVAARKILSRPFARARNNRRHQSAVARLACALGFVLEVAAQLPAEREAEARVLAQLAVDHAKDLLRKAPDDEIVLPYLERLACVANWTMRDGFASDRRPEWACDDQMQPFARALAAWTDPAFVAANRDRALVLFKAAAKPALDRHVECFSYGAAVNLLDAALATHRADRGIVATIRTLWVDVEAAFATYRRNTWPAQALCEAAANIAGLKTDPTTRQTLLAKVC